jgi:hypothetical protein
MTFLYTNPFTRYQDSFITSDRIQALEVPMDVLHPLIDRPVPSKVTRYQTDFYKHMAADIVTETVFDYPYPYISEKTLRPLACKRMFVVVGPAGVLEALKSRGFKTFNNIIDESYDSVKNAEDRFLAVMNSIENFCQIPLEQVKKYILDNQDVFEHNFKTLQELSQKEFQNV